MDQCLFFRQRRVKNEEMRGILLAGQSYEQTYPQKLGRMILYTFTLITDLDFQIFPPPFLFRQLNKTPDAQIRP